MIRRLAPAFVLSSFLLLASPLHAQFPPPPGTGPGLPETIEAIDAARVTTRILYITAHPDDESAAVLTYLARGLHADVALLSLTRGEGGQNALGPEQAPQLGLIRTQELLAATRGYGVHLYFTRARDFGFSKTPAESERLWGDQVLEDMVRVIREFRPNLVINNWAGVNWGHGHHQAAGLLTPKAVALAADPNAYPALPGARTYVWNGDGTPVQILGIERGGDASKGILLPLDEVSPLYGKTWREIGLDAFVNHRTQGMTGVLNSPYLTRPIALVPTDGQTLKSASLTLSLAEYAARPSPCGCDNEMKEADASLAIAHDAVLRLDWTAAVAALIAADQQVDRASLLSVPLPVPPDLYARLFFLRSEKEKVNRALSLAAGLQLSARADRPDIVFGEEFSFAIQARCRQGMDCRFQPATLRSGYLVRDAKSSGDSPASAHWTLSLQARQQEKPQPLLPPPPGPDPMLPLPEPLVTVAQKIQLNGYEFTMDEPVDFIDSSSTTLSRIPLRVVPAYVLAVDPRQVIDALPADGKPFDVFLRVHSYSTKAADVLAGLHSPDGLKSTPPVPLHFAGAGDQYAQLRVTPPAKLEAGTFPIAAFVRSGSEEFTTSLTPLPSMPTLLWSEPAQCLFHAFPINVPANLHVGYVSAENEPVPAALRRLGMDVTLLDPTALAFGDLSRFSAIVIGVRSYEIRSDLASANKRLLDYVSAGGTLVVQYNLASAWDKLQPAPYPATIGNPTPRITDESSPVTLLKPDDPLLTFPNKITVADFQGWIQERGLYFWSTFDSRYTPLLSMNDPGESPLNGGLVYTRYGKGTYIYTGLAFFRELPEGVPGAYRLFVNLLSASVPH